MRDLLDRGAAETQVGGGLRSTERVQDVLAAGARFAVADTRALEDEDWLADVAAANPGQIILAAQVRDRRVVSPAWTRVPARDLFDLLESLAGVPLGGLLVTLTDGEGELRTRDLSMLEDMVDVAAWPVVAAGGLETIEGLHALQNRGVSAAVIGAALYNGALDPWAVAQEFSE